MGNTQISKKPPIKARIKKALYSTGIGIFSFSFLLYFFFPYSILKNYVVSELRLILIQNQIPADIDVKTLKPYLLTGIKLKDASIHSVYENQRNPLLIKTLTVRLEFLPLLIGRLGIKTNIELEEGNSDIFISAPIFSLLSGNLNNITIESKFKHFQIEGLVDQYFGFLQNANPPSLALLTPVIRQTSVGGFLDGNFNFKSDDTTNGLLNLTISNFYLSIDDPSLNIPIQHFKQAKANFTWDTQGYTINKNTTFESENLFFKPTGSIQIFGQEPFAQKVLNIEFLLILSGDIQKSFGFLIPQLLKCPSSSMTEGVMNVRLVGPISNYVCQ